MESSFLWAVFAAALPEVTEGRLTTVVGKAVVDVPLERTEVAIEVDGHLVRAEVVQKFRNPYGEKIEALYLFPLPADAAVDAMEIETNGRRIEGRLLRREQAELIYERARRRGHVAALLREQRPNLFKQAVANIEPGASVDVRIRYVEALAPKEGTFEVHFPMVAGPRYLPGAKQDADLQPAVLPPEVRSSHEIRLSVSVAGPVSSIASPSHLIDVAKADRTLVTLSPRDVIPNRDFVLRYRLASGTPAIAMAAHRTGDVGSFFLMLDPPAIEEEAVVPREIVFVVDASSSMAGAPIEKAKALIESALDRLRPDDTFSIVRFGDRAEVLGRQPLARESATLAKAWIGRIQGRGGTEMLSGLEAAFGIPRDPLRLRIVVFISDGFIGNEEEVLALVHRRRGDARVFAFGVGSVTNRYLLEEMAVAGRGTAVFVRPDEPTAPVVERFARRIDRPVITDVAVDWNGLLVEDVLPDPIPDLFDGEPLVIAGRYRTPGRGVAIVTGRTPAMPVRFEVPIALPALEDRPAVATVWARRRIADLSRRALVDADPSITSEIIALALEHRLSTRYTAFVAVDPSRVTEGGDPKVVPVPVEVPEGLGAGGRAAGLGSAGHALGIIGMSSSTFGAGGLGSAAPMLLLKSDVSYDSIDRGGVDREIKRQLNRIRHCYEKQLVLDPELTGKLAARFSIDAHGKVTSVETSGLENEALAQCVAGVIRTIQFPESDAEAEVSYPFVFVNGGVK
jgi:Ca-activated chloride channel family protein